MTRFLKPRSIYLAGLGLLAAVTVDQMRRFRKADPTSADRATVAPPSPPKPKAKADPKPSASPAPAPAPAPALTIAAAPKAPVKVAGSDDLTQIKGIGPTYAKRLKDAGLTTYADIASASADDLREITRATAADPAEWISEARSLNGH